MTAADINDYLREATGGAFTAKDFRTWHAAVLAAVGLAVSAPAASGESGPASGPSPGSSSEVAGLPGQYPGGSTRASYIDPRLIELYERGTTIASALKDLGRDRDFGELATGGHAERAVLKLLARH